MSLTDRDTIKTAAQIENLHGLKEFIMGHARKAGFEEKECGQIELAVDELLTNVISYAYPEEPGSVTVRCVTNNRGDFFIQIADSGIPAIQVQEDTAAAERRLLHCYENNKLQVFDADKVKDLEEMFERHFDFDRFIDSLSIRI